MHRLSSFLRRKREGSSLTDSTSGDSSSNNIPQAASPSRSEVEERLASSSSQSSSQPRKASQGQHYRAQMAEVKVLVYHNGGGQNPVVPKGLAIITHGELEQILKTNPALQFSKKPIPRMSHSIDIYQSDLRHAGQLSAEPVGTHPNDGSNIACVTFPVNIALGIVAGHYKELYIISKKQT